MNATATSAPNPNMIYLYAIVATGIATGAQFAIPSLGVYAAVVAAGGLVGMVMTKAGFGKATLAFLLAAAIAAVLYYFVVAGMLAKATSAAASGESAEIRAAAAQAGDEVGSAIGIFVAIVAFVQTFIPGLIGSGIGALVRPKAKTAPAHAQRVAA
jgi:hypothetical protein